jgi:aspartate/methionine/tyrosine aminotransferase
MPIAPFQLERYFAQYEFNTEYLLCSSDVQAMSMREVLALADNEMRAAWENLSLGYTESPGHPLLRRAIAGLYERIGPDDITVTTSGEEPIYISMRVLLEPGDHAIVVWPGYQSHYEIARSIGAELTLLPVRPLGANGAAGDTHWMIDLEELRSALRHNTRLLVTSFPHNPTGALPTHPQWREIARIVEDAGLHWLSDEVYRGMEYDPARKLPAAADISERALSIGALSKTYALAGLRIGWAATRDAQLRQALRSYKDYTTICNSAPSELLAIIALRQHDVVAARSVDIVKTNLAHAKPFFERHTDLFAFAPPTAGSIGFPKLLHGDVDVLADALVRSAGTLILPASTFGYPHPHFRMGFGRKNFPQALARLEAFVTSPEHAALPASAV